MTDSAVKGDNLYLVPFLRQFIDEKLNGKRTGIDPTEESTILPSVHIPYGVPPFFQRGYVNIPMSPQW